MLIGGVGSYVLRGGGGCEGFNAVGIRIVLRGRCSGLPVGHLWWLGSGWLGGGWHDGFAGGCWRSVCCVTARGCGALLGMSSCVGVPTSERCPYRRGSLTRLGVLWVVGCRALGSRLFLGMSVGLGRLLVVEWRYI